MNWERFWDHVARSSSDAIAQVQRKDEASLLATAEHLKEHLALSASDRVLDVCCGNGLLTNELSDCCAVIEGVDLSGEQITVARQYFPDIAFHKGPADQVHELLLGQQFDKIYLQFAFQYFTQTGEGERVIRSMLKLLKPGGTIFIGDIPDRDKLWRYYNTFWKRFYFITSYLRSRYQLGKFWRAVELDDICTRFGVKGEKRTQPPHLPYAHYRFDYLITS